MEYEKFLDESYKCTKDWKATAELFEKQFPNIGANVKKDRGDFIHQTKRKLYVDIRVVSRKERKFLSDVLMRNVGPKKEGELLGFVKEMAVIDEATGKAYSDLKGYTVSSELGHDVMKIQYNSRQMAKVEDLKTEHENRKAQVKAICDHFEIDDYFSNEKLIAKALYKKFNVSICGTKHVSDAEYDFIDGACQGAIMYCDVGVEFDNAFKYDVNSFYASVMTGKAFCYPVGEGEFKTLKTIEDKKKPAIYQLEIKGKHKYWKNTGGYYTNYHVMILDLLKIEYVLKETENNALVWDSYLTGDKSFNYFHELYEFKKNGNKYSKDIINTTWGILSREAEYEIPEEDYKACMASRVLRFNFERGTVTLVKDTKYRHVTGRLKPFVLSMTRFLMLRDYLLPLEKQNKKIYWVNTDGFLTDATVDEVEDTVLFHTFGPDIGDLKVEKEYKGKHKVVNMRVISEI
jgi:hypothetical protein